MPGDPPRPPARSLLARARAIAVASALTAVALTGAAPTTAQTVIGRVVDDVTTTPLAVTTVMLLDSADTAVRVGVADSTGWFALQAPRDGRYRLFADRLGYAEVVSDTLDVAAGRSTQVLIRMIPKPVELEAIEVTAERRYVKLEEKGFYRRQAFAPGYFIDAQQIIDEKPTYTTDLLRMVPGVNVRWSEFAHANVVTNRRPLGWGGGQCIMRVVLDGWSLDSVAVDQFVGPAEVIGVEVYPGAGGVGAPVQYRGPESYCGIIMIWTR